ncbi:class I SAM-dependent methyltransferase [Desulfurivibrio alkaliphilus]|uniref:Class I SAM-dependent methyltransferase n=1 Tax=Desulfurivibrio alkaliphilus (strain DSM 19089 / UNIQEM U267 / AHT2) TaxID=589865 RepID=D6Z4P5_DESAT|nr:class I SAM-dependent methyltransferase [Desulfurivibrio alkaliphilus]ADH86520.1 hypothetical protein DaAHT2_1839 [Desulfurivibrio alkaliphilus AHT 2]
MDQTAESKEARIYLENGYKEVNGWLGANIPKALDCCVTIMKQHDHKWEHSLEIGVHEGKFFIPIERVTPDDKEAVAIDVFDIQMFNIDKSGLGNLQRFMANISKYCRLPGRVVVEKEDSFNMRMTHLNDRNYSLISVDGGHTVQHVMFDMEFAAERLQPGGIIILDDFPNNSWLGVLEGITLYFHRQSARVAPFAVGYNKLFITTVSYQKIYFEEIRKNIQNFGLDEGRITQFCGWPIQALAQRHFRPI